MLMLSSRARLEDVYRASVVAGGLVSLVLPDFRVTPVVCQGPVVGEAQAEPTAQQEIGQEEQQVGKLNSDYRWRWQGDRHPVMVVTGVQRVYCRSE